VRRRLPAMFTVMALAPVQVRAHLPEPHEGTFANGLRVLVLEDHAAPCVSVQVWFHVGSKDETPGKRGLAHMFEHLMFRGTAAVGPGGFDDALDAVGGENNAFTSEDVTAFHEMVPADALDLTLRLEADRMRGLVVTQSILDAEREVVKEEKRLRLDNDPAGKALLVFREAAFPGHPYAWTPAGEISDLDSLTVEDARAFYDRFYRPDNAVLVIVGDVDPAAAMAGAHRRFDGVERGRDSAATVSHVHVPIAAQTAMRASTLPVDVEVPMIVGGYHVPGAASPDRAPLEALSRILSGGESSRMYRSLVKGKKLAVFAGGSLEAFEDGGLFLVEAGFLPGQDPAAVREALLAEVDRIATKGVTDREVTKAKNQLVAAHVFGLDGAEGKGMSLGDAELLQGGYRAFLEETARYEAVRGEDVQRVAREYLVRSNLSIVTVVPK
jgi:zinc protease